jgi:hypothetical protein
MTEEKDSKNTIPIHPIASAMGRFNHQIQDIELCLKEFLPLSIKNVREQSERIKSDLDKMKTQLKDSERNIIDIVKSIGFLKELERLINSNIPSVLRKSLFLGLFSVFDRFTGELLEAIFLKKPELLHSLNRQIAVSEVFESSSFDEFKKRVLRDDIDDFRRKSYVKQFEELENMFSLNLKKFDGWPKFVECSQRRNLITHCNGLVSEQYISECKKAGFPIEGELKIGDQIGLPVEYLLASCDLLREVAIKLGMVLWRSIFPEETEAADREFDDIIYDLLQNEKWNLAIEHGRFYSKFKNVRETSEKICMVNYGIALCFSGQKEKVMELFKGVDWSAALLDFQLAKAVLVGANEHAVEIMKRIGKKGQIVQEYSYHIWPLFIDFRKTSEFLTAYEEIYGYSFVQELKREMDKEKQKLNDQVDDNGNQEGRNF